LKGPRLAVPPAGARPEPRRRAWPHTFIGRLAVLAAAAAVCWTVVAFGVQYVRTYSLAREAARLERHRQDLLVQNASLLTEIRRLRTDDQYIERLAREQLGMLRPGEIELVIVPLAPTKRHNERDPATVQVVAPPPDRLDSAKELLQRVTEIVRGMLETLRAAAERALERWHPAPP
jgi:cell division protein FtsB